MITQCYASMYYSLHETGHRLGFNHANIYRLSNATQAPADPIGEGIISAEGYRCVRSGKESSYLEFLLCLIRS